MKPAETWPEVAFLLALIPLAAGLRLYADGDAVNGLALMLASVAGGVFVLVASRGRRSRRGGG